MMSLTDLVLRFRGQTNDVIDSVSLYVKRGEVLGYLQTQDDVHNQSFGFIVHRDADRFQTLRYLCEELRQVDSVIHRIV